MIKTTRKEKDYAKAQSSKKEKDHAKAQSDKKKNTNLCWTKIERNPKQDDAFR